MKSFSWKIIVILGAILVGLGVALPKLLSKNTDVITTAKTAYIDTIAHTNLLVKVDEDDLREKLLREEMLVFRKAFRAGKIKTAQFKNTKDLLSVTFENVNDEHKGVQVLRDLTRPFETIEPNGEKIIKDHIKISARTIRSYNIEFTPEYFDQACKKVLVITAKSLQNALALQKTELVVVKQLDAQIIRIQMANIDVKREGDLLRGLNAGTLPAKLRVIERNLITP